MGSLPYFHGFQAWGFNDHWNVPLETPRYLSGLCTTSTKPILGAIGNTTATKRDKSFLERLANMARRNVDVASWRCFFLIKTTKKSKNISRMTSEVLQTNQLVAGFVWNLWGFQECSKVNNLSWWWCSNGGGSTPEKNRVTQLRWNWRWD